METQEDLEITIGTKENVALKPMKVKIEKIEIESQKDKNGKVIGDKVVCSCKHPDKEELIKISTVKYEKKNKINVTGTWFNKDEDGLIKKGSALAILLQYLGAMNIRALEGREVDTSTDDNGYLCLKAY